jgi:fluoroquinolone transport system ATP-binding protein
VRVEYAGNSGTEAREFPLETIGRDAQFLELIKTRQIETIHSQEATLEDIFIEMTGRALSENGEGGQW